MPILLQQLFGTQIDDILLLFLIVTSLYFYGLIWWHIFNKAGYKPSNGLLMYIPFINLVMLALLAFKEWPFTSTAYMRSLRHAIWYERKGDVQEAIKEYEDGIHKLRRHIDALKERALRDDEQSAFVKML